MDKKCFGNYIKKISQAIAENESYLTELDAKFGDGDLGISMRKGVEALCRHIGQSNEQDIGQLLLSGSQALNAAAPSTLGTVLSLWLMGMAKSLMGKKNACLREIALAMDNGLELICGRTGAAVGDRTIIDSLAPAIQALLENSSDPQTALPLAYAAAQKGADTTRNQIAKFGRMSYYGEQVLGTMDGGAMVGVLIFRALCNE